MQASLCRIIGGVNRKALLVLLLVVISVIGGTAAYLLITDSTPEPQAETQSPPAVDTPEPDSQQNQEESFNKEQHSTEDPDSIWVIVNKLNRLPEGYRPSDLTVPNTTLRLSRTHEQMQVRQIAAEALERMLTDAKSVGLNLILSSGYRSESLQWQFYNSYVSRDGQAAADRYSARPGYSEHQTGLAVDFGRADQKCHLEICFGSLPEGQWLAANAHTYGFIIRYPEGKEHITGYQYEPWHLRYVGEALAAELKSSNQTLESFFGLEPAASYAD